MPPGATHLAASDRYINQAFAYGKCALELQFHPEVTAKGLATQVIHRQNLKTVVKSSIFREQTNLERVIINMSIQQILIRYLNQKQTVS